MTVGALRRERGPVTILHIEDNPENRMLVRALLEAEGYTVVDAEDGLAGIEAAVREQPALILLDINLPGVDGYEVGVILKSFPALAQVPIIAVTAYAMEGDRQRTLVAGCDGYIAKPIDSDTFARQVGEFLRGKRERVEEQAASVYLRELNQRLVYRLVNQVEELKRLNQQSLRRAAQLEELHGAVQDITSNLDLRALLEQLLPALARALGIESLAVELSDPPGLRIAAEGPRERARHGVLDGPADAEAAAEAEWRLPLTVHGRALGVMTARHAVPAGARLETEQLLKIVANQVAIAVENSRLYAGSAQRAAEAQSLVEAGRLLASTLELSEVLHRLAELVRQRLETDCVVRIWLREGDRPEFRLRAQAGTTHEVPPERVRAGEGAGLIAWIVEHRTSVVVDDLRTDPRIRNQDRVRDEGLVSYLGVPLMLDDQPVGILTVASRQPRTFAREEVALVEALATSAAVAIWNARLFAAQKEEAEVSASLLRLAQAVESVRGLDELLDTVVRTTAPLLGTGQCSLFLVDPAEGGLVPAASYGLPAEQREAYDAFRGRPRIPALVRAIETQEPVIVQAEGEVGLPPETVAALAIRAMLIIPLVSGGRLMGVMAAHTPGQARPFSPKEIALARGIAAHAAVAIEKARLYRQTQARLRETETLLTITRQLSSTLDPTETLRRVAREIARALGADMVGAYLADVEAGVLRPVAGYHVPEELYEKFLQYPVPIRGHAGVEEAWQRGQTLWSDDVLNDPRLDRTTVERFPHQSLLFVPMTAKGQPIGGFFVVWWQERRQFTAEEIRLVEGISDQAAMFIENARLYSEATRRRREAEELARLARMLTESLDAADVGERIVESSLLLLGGTFSVLRLLQPDGSLKLIASRGDARALARLLPVIPAGTGVAGRAAQEGAPVWSADILEDGALALPGELRERVRELGLRGYLAVPLRVKREIVGVIGIGDTARRVFSTAEVALLQTFADQAAIALENSRLYGDLRAALRAVEESQQRIVQGERLRALGEMAGGVAHDFNNVLAIIVGRAEVLLNETEDPELQRQLNVIIKVALDAAQTVKRIQEFTRMRRSRPFQPVNLTQLIDEVVEVTRTRWKDEAQSKGIQYDVVTETGPTPPIAGDPSEIREALTNIVFNALDAMPDGGRVTLRTAVEGDRVVCAVSDTGVGMSEDVRQRIFDPFFTTKGERGTGLGLSVVYGIVTRHGADLEVQSQLGQGSTFVIRFPLAGEGMVETAARPPATSNRKGRVLVIDDEREVADVLGDVLRRDGHEVVVCADGEAGLALVEREAFDLVITDLGMPGLSGWEVARLVKQWRPGTPVAMVTGWGDRIDPAEAESRGVDYLVGKPFKRDGIREMVTAALAAPPPQPSSAGA